MLDTKTGDSKLVIADEISEKSGMLIFFIFIAQVLATWSIFSNSIIKGERQLVLTNVLDGTIRLLFSIVVVNLIEADLF